MGVTFIIDCSASSSKLLIHRALDIMDTYPDYTECSVYYFNNTYETILVNRPIQYISYERLIEAFHPCGSTALYDTVCAIVSRCGWLERVYIITDGGGDTSSSIHVKRDMDDLLYWRPFIYTVIEGGETQPPEHQPPPLVRSKGSIFDSASVGSV